MKARRVARVVDHRAADAVAGVVLAELDGILAADHARRGPVELVLAGLVGDPVAVGVPERAGLEHDDPPAAAREALGERRAAGARADDHHVDLVVVGVAAHRAAPGIARRWTSSRNAESLSRGGREPLHRASPGTSTGSRLEGLERLVRIAPGRARCQAHVAARVGGAAEPDLVPRPRVRVERRQHARASRPTRRAWTSSRRSRGRPSEKRCTIARCAGAAVVGEARRVAARPATRRHVSGSSGMSA